MSDIAIKVENLGKSYMVGHNKAQFERYTSLRDVISRNTQSFVRKTKDMLQGKAIIQGDEIEEFWALNNVSFEVKQGDRVGIIGRNGAGKSTLLKVLSRITDPTKGRVTINGRVASLLEVGTGFHPELTGRENIYLNGAILGMNRKEIQYKFDEIVDFAEVERFLDTPVKRYSSGMYVRLAFAVAAHLESDILIVDEVLAVGDAEFQRKCLGKMKEVGNEGRTVLFVSHNMDAISMLCNVGVLLVNGQSKFEGTSTDVIKEYMNQNANHRKTEVLITKNNQSGKSAIVAVKVSNVNGESIIDFENDQSIVFEIQIDKKQSVKERLVITLLNENGLVIFETSNYDIANSDLGNQNFRCSLPAPLLKVGLYEISLRLDIPMVEVIDRVESVLSFRVVLNKVHQMGILTQNEPKGVIHPIVNWERVE